MNNSNSINTPLHVVNFVASQSNFASTTNLLFRGSINYTCYRFTFAALRAEGMNICVEREVREAVQSEIVLALRLLYNKTEDVHRGVKST